MGILFVFSNRLAVTNGTASGSADLFPSSIISPVDEMAYIPGLSTVLISGRQITVGTELFQSDGSPAGTTLLSNIASGLASSDPSDFVDCGSFSLFLASNSTYGTELFKTDGLTTSLVADLTPGSASSDIQNLFCHNGTGYFSFKTVANGRQLYVTDGTEAGTQAILPFINTLGAAPAGFVFYNDWVYFSAHNDSYGREIWRTNGTMAELWLDVVPGTNSSNPTNLRVFDGYLWFSAFSYEEGRELYRGNSIFYENAGASSADASVLGWGDYPADCCSKYLLYAVQPNIGREPVWVDRTPCGCPGGDDGSGDGDNADANSVAGGDGLVALWVVLGVVGAGIVGAAGFMIYKRRAA